MKRFPLYFLMGLKLGPGNCSRIVRSSLRPDLGSLHRTSRHGVRSLQKARAEDHTQFQVIGPRGESITMTLQNVSGIKLVGNDLLYSQCISQPSSEKFLPEGGLSHRGLMEVQRRGD